MERVVETSEQIKKKLRNLKEQNDVLSAQLNNCVMTILDQQEIEYVGKKVSFDDRYNIVISE